MAVSPSPSSGVVRTRAPPSSGCPFPGRCGGRRGCAAPGPAARGRARSPRRGSPAGRGGARTASARGSSSFLRRCPFESWCQAQLARRALGPVPPWRPGSRTELVRAQRPGCRRTCPEDIIGLVRKSVPYPPHVVAPDFPRRLSAPIAGQTRPLDLAVAARAIELRLVVRTRGGDLVRLGFERHTPQEPRPAGCTSSPSCWGSETTRRGSRGLLADRQTARICPAWVAGVGF